MAENVQNKKRHHYVPITYLKGFTDADGKIYAYMANKGHEPLHLLPDNIGFRNYYYSQPKPDGEWDHNTLEDFFSDSIESKWNGIVKRIREEQKLSIEDHEVIFQFLAATRVKVPATRDAIEINLAELVKVSAKQMDAMGLLPPKPVEFPDLLDHCEVSIDPHKSIHMMIDAMKGFSQIIKTIGFEVIRNTSTTTFITSDNPVVCFDPDVPEKAMLPYNIDRQRMRIELLFPIDRVHVLRGHSDLKPRYGAEGISYRQTGDIKSIHRINRLVSRFAYEFAFAADENNASVISKYAHHSPIIKTDKIAVGGGTMLLNQSVFGTRPKKPKWKEREEQ